MCDIRVYCPKCAQDVRNAGYVLKRTDNVYKSECDKCNRIGWEYSLRGLRLGKEIRRT